MNKIKRCPFKITVKCLSPGLLVNKSTFIIKLLSSETNEAMRENKGNFLFPEKKKIEPSFMLQRRRYPFINRVNATTGSGLRCALWHGLGLLFTKQTSQPHGGPYICLCTQVFTYSTYK